MTQANHALHAQIDRLANKDAQALHILRQPSEWRPDAQRPLLIVVHPGDAIERLCDWSDIEQGGEVVERSIANQVGMAGEIGEILAGHDVVVLHRLSSTYLREPGADSAYERAIERCDEQGLVLYGDDLEAASAWFKANVAGLSQLEVEVFMTGAYADARYGCITAIGESLLAGNPRLKVQVSSWAPTDNANFSPRWSPPSERCVPT